MYDNINVVVGGPINAEYPKVYKTKFLKPAVPFALQVTESDTKYVIKYDFDLGGESVTIPDGCVLEFDGGAVSNGQIVNAKFTNNANSAKIFKNIVFVNPNSQSVNLSWFENDTVHSTIIEACKFGDVDGEGNTYILDDTVEVTNDINLRNCNFLCRKVWSAEDYHNVYIHSNDVTNEEGYASTISAGATSISVGNENKYTHVLISSDDIYADVPNGSPARHCKRGELMEIKSMTSESVTFTSPTVLAYSTNIKVKFINMINASVENCTFKGDIVDDVLWGYHLMGTYAKLKVTRCSFEGLSEGIGISDGRLLSYNNTFNDIYPYGIVIGNGANESVVYNCNFKRHRHGVCCGGEHHIAKYMVIEDNILSQCDCAIDNHTAAYGTLIKNNYIYDSYAAVEMSAPNSIIINNTVVGGKGGSAYNIYCNELGFVNATIKGNVLKNCDCLGGIEIQAANTVSCCIPLNNISVCDNTIFNCQSSGIEIILALYGNTGITGNADVVVNGNSINQIKYVGILVYGATSATIADNTLIWCTYKQAGIKVNHDDTREYNGKIAYLKNNLVIGFGGNYDASTTNHPIEADNIETLVSTGNKVLYNVDGVRPLYNVTAIYSENEYERGGTSDRPTDSRVNRYSHCEFYDTDIKKLIFWNGDSVSGEWTDAAGNVIV